MHFLNDALSRVPEYRALENAVRRGKTPAAVTGVSTVHKAAAIHALMTAVPKNALLLAGDEAEATRLLDDLNAMGTRAAFYPLRDFSLRDTEGSSHEYERQRIEALTLLQNGSIRCIVTTIDAALQYALPPEKLKERTVQLKSGQEITVTDVVKALVRCGYVRADQIDGTGQFARRGGIVDFYSPGGQAPVRIEFWGDEIDTISYFDPETQRRTDPIDAVTVSPAVEVVPDSMTVLTKKITEHAKTLRGKSAPAAKEILLREAEKLQSGMHIGCMDKYYPFIYGDVFTLFSYFDSGTHPSQSEPERFYHGFVLGLMVDLESRYLLTSNRESGFGRYDIMLEPRDKNDNAYIIEFKVRDSDDEGTLQDTVAAALAQIEEKKYDTFLLEKGVPADKIYKYGFAFEGKTVLIG